MIAELAAFNAAFGVVKTAIGHGRDIMSCAKQIGDMIGAEEQVRARGERKKNGLLSLLSGKEQNDFEEFMALEKMREARKELMSMMQLYGRPGIKAEFLKFEADARKSRREAAIEAEKQKYLILQWAVGILAALTAIGIMGVGIYFLGKTQGKW